MSETLLFLACAGLFVSAIIAGFKKRLILAALVRWGSVLLAAVGVFGPRIGVLS